MPFFDEFVGKYVSGRNNHTLFIVLTDVAQYKTQRNSCHIQSVKEVAARTPDVFMSCTNEIQQVIQVYEARYLFPKL